MRQYATLYMRHRNVKGVQYFSGHHLSFVLNHYISRLLYQTLSSSEVSSTSCACAFRKGGEG